MNSQHFCPITFKLSILQKNKWEVGQALKATLLIPSTNPPPKYGRIYHLFSGSLKNRKQYEVIINDYSTCSCVEFFSMMSVSFYRQGLWVQCKHLYYILQYAMYYGIKKPFIHYSSWSWNEVHRLLACANILELKLQCY